MLEVEDAELARLRVELETQLARDQHVAVLIAEHGHEHFVPQLRA